MLRMLGNLAWMLCVVMASGCASVGGTPEAKPEVRIGTRGTPTAAAAQSSRAVYQRGTASWYGPGFDGKKTANGETFDKSKMTAAHKTLPFGTMVLVRSTESGKTVLVRINDRHPGTKGRVIDLSEAAFKRLAPTARGLLPVELEVVSQK